MLCSRDQYSGLLREGERWYLRLFLAHLDHTTAHTNADPGVKLSYIIRRS
jgi:hypothetical protein